MSWWLRSKKGCGQEEESGQEEETEVRETKIPGHCLPKPASSLPGLSGAQVLSTAAGRTSWILRIGGPDMQDNNIYCT